MQALEVARDPRLLEPGEVDEKRAALFIEFHARGGLRQLPEVIEDQSRLYLRIERGVASSDNIVIIRWANAPASPIKVMRGAKRLQNQEGAPLKLNVTSSRLGATI